MKEWLARLKEKPWVAHLLRAVTRFGNRLGSQFAAAVTYFSILAIVPILLLSFSVLGLILTVLHPEYIEPLTEAVSSALGSTDPETREKITAQITGYLTNWKGVGIVGLLSAIYSGAGWMGNLKNAVRAQWRPDFDMQEAEGNIVKKTLINLVSLVGLLVLVAITFGLSSVSTSLNSTIVDALGLTGVGWLQPVLRFGPILVSIGAGWLLFMYLYTVLPEDREPWKVVRRGSLMGAVGLAVLQYGTGLLFSAFQKNKAAQLFGPVIVLMLFLNLFAQLILIVAAWIATFDHEAISTGGEKVRFALAPESARETDAGPAMVPRKIAARSVQVGLGAGYVTGAATGAGLGAVLAWLVSKTVRGR